MLALARLAFSWAKPCTHTPECKIARNRRPRLVDDGIDEQAGQELPRPRSHIELKDHRRGEAIAQCRDQGRRGQGHGPGDDDAARHPPPISAWLLLEGMPNIHVSTFQTIAPDSAPKTTSGSTICGSTTPLLIVPATCRPKTAKAMKLKNAAQQTAVTGRSTRVATMVAIELALSCSPFRKPRPTWH